MSGTLALSWGRWGGFYLHRHRACLGWVAVTYTPVEIDDLMEGYTQAYDPAIDWRQVARLRREQVERMRLTLQEITEPDWWENALDPQRASRIAKARIAFELSVDRGEVPGA